MNEVRRVAAEKLAEPALLGGRSPLGIYSVSNRNKAPCPVTSNLGRQAKRATSDSVKHGCCLMF